MPQGARAQGAPEDHTASLPLSLLCRHLPSLALRPRPDAARGAASLEGENDPADAAQTNTTHVRTASPTSAWPGLVCLQGCLWEGQAANSPAGAHLPPPQTASLGCHRARGTLKKKLQGTGVHRGLGVLAPALNFAISTPRPTDLSTVPQSWQPSPQNHSSSLPKTQGPRLRREGRTGSQGEISPAAVRTRPRSQAGLWALLHGRSLARLEDPEHTLRDP